MSESLAAVLFIPHYASGVESRLELSAEQLEYLFMGLHALQEQNQRLVEETKGKTISRNDVVEALGGAREDPILNPDAARGENVSDMFSAQFVDVKALLKQLREARGYDMALES